MSLEIFNAGKAFIRKKGRENVFYAVKESSAVFEKGKIYGITGKSGSGKSTFLYMCCGLVKPDEGKVVLDGKDLSQLSDLELSDLRNRSFGIIPQKQVALPSLNVLENVKLPCLLAGNADHELNEKCLRILQRVGIADLACARPSELSGGEMRRLCIARALINDPDYIFADEPTNDLDAQNSDSVLNLLREIAHEWTGVIVVSHERNISDFADVMYRMEAGKLS